MGWITWNGRHIFVEEGSSKIKAIGKAIKSYRSRSRNIKNKKLDEDIHKIGLAATNAFANGDAERGYELDDKRADLIYDKNKLNEKQVIKGRIKTEYEKARAYADSLPDIDDRKSRNDLLTSKEAAYIKAGKIKDKQKDKSYKLKGVDKVKIKGYKDYSNYFDKTNTMRRADEKYNNEIRKINSSTRGRIAERAKGISPGNKGKRTDIARQEWNKADKLKTKAEAERKKAYTFKRKK